MPLSIFKTSFYESKASMETPTLLVNGIVNNVVAIQPTHH